MKTDTEKQVELLKDLLRVVIELLPNHSTDCGVHKAHRSYGNTYCDCRVSEMREEIRKKLVEL